MSKKNSLLSDAIADAKNIKKVALATAKEQLEETFGPKLRSMLAAKLAEDMDEDEDVNVDDTDETTDEAKKKVDAPEDEDENEDEVEEVTDVTDEVKNDDSEEEASDDEELDENGDIDLDELLASIDEKKKAKKVDTSDEEDTEEGSHVEDEEEDLEETSGKFDLGSFLDELRNEYASAKKINETKKKAKANVNFSKQKPSSSGSGIGENVVKQIQELKKLVNDVNLINNKQLYLNKTLVENTLTDKQKIDVLKAFDKAETAKEAKFIYESFAQAFKINKSSKAKSIKENLGLSSKSAGTSTKKIITEQVVDAQRERFQILAGLKKRN